MKVGIYTRVSTEEQAREGYSISGQLQKLKAFSVSQNWEVADIYVDEGISAKDMNRPSLQRMLKDIKEHKIDVVLVYRLDRLTRSVFDLYKMLETFDEYNCKFKSATEVYDTTTAMGRMFITIVAALAQWERENMGERIAFGFEEKVRQGKCPLNEAPIGFDLNREESKLYINPVEAETVRTIFDKYLSGLGSGKLCNYLNDNDIRTKRGNKWVSDTLFKVLKSPVPAGGIRWAGKTYWDMHEPIVSREDWKEAQRLMKVRKTWGPATVSSTYLFSTLIKCEECGQALIGKRNRYTTVKGEVREYYYYLCANARVGTCGFRTKFAENFIEKEFLKKISNWDFSKTSEKIAEEGVPEKPVIHDEEKLKKELEKIEGRKKKWQYAWVEGILNENDFKVRMEEENKKEKSILDKLEDTSPIEEDDTPDVKEIEAMLLGINENWNVLERLEKKNLLREIIKEIKVSRVGNTTRIDDIIFA